MDGVEIQPVGIPPVADEAVEKFEIPPRESGDGGQEEEFPAAVGEERPPRAAEDESVEEKDESEPEREEGVLCGDAGEIEAAPGEEPGNEQEAEAEAAVEREGVGPGWRGCRTWFTRATRARGAEAEEQDTASRASAAKTAKRGQENGVCAGGLATSGGKRKNRASKPHAAPPASGNPHTNAIPSPMIPRFLTPPLYHAPSEFVMGSALKNQEIDS